MIFMVFGSSVGTQNPFLAPHGISRLLFVKPAAGTSWMMAMVMLFSGYFSVSGIPAPTFMLPAQLHGLEILWYSFVVCANLGWLHYVHG